MTTTVQNIKGGSSIHYVVARNRRFTFSGSKVNKTATSTILRNLHNRVPAIVHRIKKRLIDVESGSNIPIQNVTL
jgi:hypothetical protein